MMCRGCGYDEAKCRCGDDHSVVHPPPRTRKPFSDVAKLARLDPGAAQGVARKIRGLIKGDPRGYDWRRDRRIELQNACSDRAEGYRAMRRMEFGRAEEAQAWKGY